MTLQSDLNLITNTVQTGAVDKADTFIAGPGKTGIAGFLQQEARKGRRTALLHMDQRFNPQTLSSGYATLSGELAIINSPATPGVIQRNGVGWMYLGIEGITQAQWASIIADMVLDLTVTEGLTVTNVVGNTIADLTISW